MNLDAKVIFSAVVRCSANDNKAHTCYSDINEMSHSCEPVTLTYGFTLIKASVVERQLCKSNKNIPLPEHRFPADFSLIDVIQVSVRISKWVT